MLCGFNIRMKRRVYHPLQAQCDWKIHRHDFCMALYHGGHYTESQQSTQLIGPNLLPGVSQYDLVLIK
jgi:hypothetical protein